MSDRFVMSAVHHPYEVYNAIDGTCVKCGQEQNHNIHQQEAIKKEEEVIAETARYHRFIGTGVWCGECGRAPDFLYHIHSNAPKPETIAEEAQRIVYGDREKAYDDPNRNFRKLALMIQAVLDSKLVPGAIVTPNDAGLILECLKICRESFRPNRENRVDGVGYWLCIERIVAEQEKTNAE